MKSTKKKKKTTLKIKKSIVYTTINLMEIRQRFIIASFESEIWICTKLEEKKQRDIRNMMHRTNLTKITKNPVGKKCKYKIK